jgi:hypothetical protein
MSRVQRTINDPVFQRFIKNTNSSWVSLLEMLERWSLLSIVYAIRIHFNGVYGYDMKDDFYISRKKQGEKLRIAYVYYPRLDF